MERYSLFGTVLPERATVEAHEARTSGETDQGHALSIELSIKYNSVLIHIDTDQDIDIFTLRNIAYQFASAELELFGFLLGLSHRLEITRIFNAARAIDCVYGISLDALKTQFTPEEREHLLFCARNLLLGVGGTFIRRALRDMIEATRTPEDGAFHCFRALESLRHHACWLRAFTGEKKEQWNVFNDVAGTTKADSESIGVAAMAAQHGEPASVQADDQVEVLLKTGALVSRYFRAANAELERKQAKQAATVS